MSGWLLLDEKGNYLKKDVFSLSVASLKTSSGPETSQGLTLTTLFHVKAELNPRGLIRGGAVFWLSKGKSSFKGQWECSTQDEILAAIRCTWELHTAQTEAERGMKKDESFIKHYCAVTVYPDCLFDWVDWHYALFAISWHFIGKIIKSLTE